MAATDFQLHQIKMKSAFTDIHLERHPYFAFPIHQEKMASVLDAIRMATHCHGCGRQGIPVALIGYAYGTFCKKRPCSRWDGTCYFGDDCKQCFDNEINPVSLAFSNFHRKFYEYGSRTIWPMTGKESNNKCIAEREPLFIPWVRGPESDPQTDRYTRSYYDDWFVSKGY